MRALNGKLIGTMLKLSGSSFRFSKRYRWESTLAHAIIYRLIDTVGANRIAG